MSSSTCSPSLLHVNCFQGLQSRVYICQKASGEPEPAAFSKRVLLVFPGHLTVGGDVAFCFFLPLGVWSGVVGSLLFARFWPIVFC